MDLAFADVRILQCLFNWGHTLSEMRHAQFLKLGTGHVLAEVLTFSQSLTVDLCRVGT